MKCMNINEHTIFVWDGIGAVLSALTLGLVLPTFQAWIGMPVRILHQLAYFACVYALYDFCCVRWSNKKNPKWLCIVVIANISHTLLTIFYLLSYINQITFIGMMYFMIEILIVWWIVYYEICIVKDVLSNID